MSRDSTSDKRRVSLTIFLIVALPLIPAIIVQYFVQKRPPGSSITQLAKDVETALKSLPSPSGPPRAFRYDLAQGATWTVKSVWRPVGTPRGELLAEEDESFRRALEQRSGRWRFEVLERDEEAAIVRMASVDEASTWVGDGITLRWDEVGALAWERPDEAPPGADRGPREAILLETGVWIPGPFLAEYRTFESIGLPIVNWSFRAQLVARHLNLSIGLDAYPPQGGILHAGEALDGTGRVAFEFLSYRRRPAVGPQWTGRFEATWRGRTLHPPEAVHLIDGEIRLHEVFELRGNDDALWAVADYTMKITLSSEAP